MIFVGKLEGVKGVDLGSPSVNGFLSPLFLVFGGPLGGECLVFHVLEFGFKAFGVGCILDAGDFFDTQARRRVVIKIPLDKGVLGIGGKKGDGFKGGVGCGSLGQAG